MATAAEKLFALQQLDTRIRKLRRELRDIPGRKQDIQATCDTQKKLVAAAREEVLSRQGKARQIESDIEAEKARIRKFRQQQLELKTNKEFKAMDDEIRVVEQKIAELEDAELGCMEHAEQASASVKAAQGTLGEAERRAAAEAAVLDKRAAEIEAEIAGLDTERQAAAAGVDFQWLKQYELILENKGNAVVRVEHGVCTGCNMKIQPQLVHHARQGNLLVRCDHCGRLLC